MGVGSFGGLNLGAISIISNNMTRNAQLSSRRMSSTLSRSYTPPTGTSKPSSPSPIYKGSIGSVASPYHEIPEDVMEQYLEFCKRYNKSRETFSYKDMTNMIRAGIANPSNHISEPDVEAIHKDVQDRKDNIGLIVSFIMLCTIAGVWFLFR